jgi:hypothetical protein
MYDPTKAYADRDKDDAAFSELETKNRKHFHDVAYHNGNIQTPPAGELFDNLIDDGFDGCIGDFVKSIAITQYAYIHCDGAMEEMVLAKGMRHLIEMYSERINKVAENKTKEEMGVL